MLSECEGYPSRAVMAQYTMSHQDQQQAIHLLNEEAHFTRELERLEGLTTNVSSSLRPFTWQQPIWEEERSSLAESTENEMLLLEESLREGSLMPGGVT